MMGSVVKVPICEILRDDRFQVRRNLSGEAVARYAAAYKAEVELPPIHAAKLQDGLVLVDGWHRVAAKEKLGDVWITAEILDVASEDEVRWLAARANLTHGVPLASRELRAVFRAYVQAGEHRTARGGLKSYREIARDVPGRSHGTIRNWMKVDFPEIAAAMAGEEPERGQGGLRENPGPTGRELCEGLVQQVLAAFRTLGDPEERGEIIQEVEEVLRAMKVGEPWKSPQHDF